MSIELTIHSAGTGVCSLSSKECDGITVTFKDGTLREGFLSHKAFLQLVAMKFSQGSKPEVKIPMALQTNGPVAAAK